MAIETLSPLPEFVNQPGKIMVGRILSIMKLIIILLSKQKRMN
jgi:hypothetical protein